jgi:hypothetical protein
VDDGEVEQETSAQGNVEESLKEKEVVEEEQLDMKIKRLLEPDDNIDIIFNCGSVDGLDKAGMLKKILLENCTDSV